MKQRLVAVFVGIAMTLFVAADAQEKTKYSNAEIMQRGMKDGLAKKMWEGRANDADKARLLDYVTALHANRPKRGPIDDWRKVTQTLVDAVTSGNRDEIEKAANCRACHLRFR